MTPAKKIKFLVRCRRVSHKIPSLIPGCNVERYIRDFGALNGLKPTTYSIGGKVVEL